MKSPTWKGKMAQKPNCLLDKTIITTYFYWVDSWILTYTLLSQLMAVNSYGSCLLETRIPHFTVRRFGKRWIWCFVAKFLHYPGNFFVSFRSTPFKNSLCPFPFQVRWTKTAGSASDKFQETSIYNETLRIEGIQRVQGGRYYCKADNGVGVAAIKSIRVDVQCK